MNVWLIVAIILLIILGYFYILEIQPKKVPRKHKKKIQKPEISTLKNRYIYIRQSAEGGGKYIAVNKLTRFLYLVEDINKAEIFTVDKFPENRTKKNEETNKIHIKSSDNFYVNLKYSISHKKEYDVVAGNEYISNLSKLRLLKDSNGYYIELINGYYLCISNGLLFCSKDLSKIFYFNFVVKNNQGKARLV